MFVFLLRSWSLFLFLLLCLPSVYGRKTVIDLLSQSANFSQVILALQQSRLVPYINSMKACTMFAPTDEAFRKSDLHTLTLQALEGREEARRRLRDRMLYHIVPDALWDRATLLRRNKDNSTNYWIRRQDTLHQTRILDSAYKNGTWMGGDGLGVRIDFSWKPSSPDDIHILDEDMDRIVMRVGGSATVLRADIGSSSGVVHELDAVITPPPDLATQLSQLAGTEALQRWLASLPLHERLAQPGPWTLFIPSDQQIQHMKLPERIYLSHMRGREDLDKMLSYHVYPGKLYASELMNGVYNETIDTLEGESVTVEKDEYGQVMINHGRLSQIDILGSNGVLHLSSQVLWPSKLEMNSYKYLIGLNATRFADALTANQLDHYVNDTQQAFTILAVGDEEMMRRLRNDGEMSVQRMLADVDEARQLRYHLLPGALQTERQRRQLDTTPYQLARTVLAEASTKYVPQPVRVQFDSTGAISHVNDAPVRYGPVIIGKHTLYLLERPLDAPTNISSFLNSFEDGHTLLEALEKANQLLHAEHQQGITMFVPSRQAFDELGLVYDALMQPEAIHRLRQVVQTTLSVNGLLYTDTISVGRHELKTLSGDILTLERLDTPRLDGQPHLVLHGLSPYGRGNATVTRADLPIRNGVAHQIDHLIFPKTVRFSLREIFQAANTTAFLEAMERCGLGDLLDIVDDMKLWDGYTFFVPTDAVFAELFADLASGKFDKLRRILLAHVVRGRVDYEGEDGTAVFKTLLGGEFHLAMRQEQNQLMVAIKNGADAEVPAENWVKVERSGRLPIATVYRINGVLLGDLPGVAWWKLLLLVLVASGLLGAACWYGYRRWLNKWRQRGGYTAIA
jgi:uncharacterized surface protein with fasciclin (FAS1) repeats